MSDGMGREFTYLSSHATNRYFIPNWGILFGLLLVGWHGRDPVTSQTSNFRLQTSPLNPSVILNRNF